MCLDNKHSFPSKTIGSIPGPITWIYRLRCPLPVCQYQILELPFIQLIKIGEWPSQLIQWGQWWKYATFYLIDSSTLFNHFGCYVIWLGGLDKMDLETWGMESIWNEVGGGPVVSWFHRMNCISNKPWPMWTCRAMCFTFTFLLPPSIAVINVYLKGAINAGCAPLWAAPKHLPTYYALEWAVERRQWALGILGGRQQWPTTRTRRSDRLGECPILYIFILKNQRYNLFTMPLVVQ